MAQANNKTTNFNNDDVSRRFDAYITDAMQLWKTPGLSVVVVKDKQVVYKKGYGVAELGKNNPFTTSTLSVCASTTKAMTAVCMGILVDEGKVKWTVKVSDVYPAFKLYDNYANNEITIKDLFTHNTGLGNADMLWALDYGVDTIIQKMRYIKPAYSFRSSFVYQNLMYMVAGEVIHRVSGKPWDQFIKERLFIPLGMTHTYPNYKQSSDEQNHITPHYMYKDSVVKPILFTDSKSIDAAGGVWSCADDINKWMIFLLDSAIINGKRLLQPATYKEIFAPHAIVSTDEFYPTASLTKPHFTTYGLGWFQEDYKGKMVQFHTGSLDGAVAILGLIPDDNFGVYIFANMDHTEIRHALMYKAMDLWVLNEDKDDWSKSFYKMYVNLDSAAKKEEQKSEAKRALHTKPSLTLTAYKGKYSNEIYGSAQIQEQGDSLVIKFPNNINLALSHWNYDTFQGSFEHDWWGKTLIQFSLNKEGMVSQFNFAGIDYDKDE
jgi:CubicO group peptidase (beta-lactamase class C family)